MDDPTGPPSGRPPALDGVGIGRLVELGGEPFLRQMIDLVLPQAEDRIAAAREGLAKGDFAAARLAVHSLRSTAGNVGATLLLAASTRAEELAVEERDAELRETLDEISAEWIRVRAALEERREKGAP
jgi:HPt (histidine-containing phosphotransfer) domain-containing protein